MQARRDNIYQRIVQDMLEYDFQRGLRIRDDDGMVLGFKSYEEFKAAQREMANVITEEDVRFLEMLAQRMPTIDLMDKESMVAFEMDGFCWNKDGTLVFSNPR